MTWEQATHYSPRYLNGCVRPRGLISPELLLLDLVTGSSWRGLRKCRFTMKIATKMRVETIARVTIRSGHTPLSVLPVPQPCGVADEGRSASGQLRMVWLFGDRKRTRMICQDGDQWLTAAAAMGLAMVWVMRLVASGVVSRWISKREVYHSGRVCRVSNIWYQGWEVRMCW